MAVDSYLEIPIELFGSLCTFPDEGNLPNGLSPDNQDIVYTPGGYTTRPGLGASIYTATGGITGLASFVDQVLTRNLLVLSDDGVLAQDTALAGALVTLSNTLTLNSYMVSTTLFDQQWIALGDRKTGLDAPRRWDNSPISGGTYLVDRVSQYGPGAAPTVVDGAAGSIPAGAHSFGVAFILRSGAVTQLSPLGSWVAGGGAVATVTAIPVGPANVVARILAFSNAATTVPVFSTAAMLIADNVTTTASVNFTAAQLSAGEDVTYLLTRRTLPYAGGCTSYSDRTFWWGCENAVPFFNNLDFAGGFLVNRPLGWTNGASAAGQGRGTAAGPFASNDVYTIVGDGATATRGQINQSAYVDPYSGAKLLQPNTAYLIRAKVKKDAGLAAGRLNIHLFGTAVNTTGLQLTAANATAKWVDYSATLTLAIAGPLPADLILEIFADQTPTNLQKFYVTELRILPSAQPNDVTSMFVSGASAPEAFDAVQGLLSPGPGDGQAVRCGFILRNFFYIVKERSLWVTQDDGVNEPLDWSTTLVDDKAGTSSPLGVGVGEGFAVIAGRNGAYLFMGGVPVKLTKEIQDLWDSINWQYGHLVTVTVHTQKQQIRIAAPFDAAIVPNKVLVIDFSEGWADPYVEVDGGLQRQAGARKWTIWNIAANAMGVIEQADGDDLDYFGVAGGARSGRIYKLIDGVYNDDGAAINGYNTTAYLKPARLGAGRKLFGYLMAAVDGQGTLLTSLFLEGTVQKVIAPQGQAGFTLSNPASRDLMATIDATSERVAVRMGTNAVDEWCSVSSIRLWAKKAPWAPVWGRST